MGGLLEGAKRKIWSIATSVVDTNPDADIRIGLVAYRDIGDEYVTKTFDLTTDIQDIYANLLELKARGGGDWPESVNEALDVAVNKLQWTKGNDTHRIVFLVGDAPPHMDYAQDTKYPKTLAVARQRDIVVNAVLAGSARDTERVWQDIAQLGDGRFIPIPQDGGEVVMIETPYDDEIIILQKEINGTVIPYGPQNFRSASNKKPGSSRRSRPRRLRQRPTWRAISTNAPRCRPRPSPATAIWSAPWRRAAPRSLASRRTAGRVAQTLARAAPNRDRQADADAQEPE